MPTLYLINPAAARPQQYGTDIVAELTGTRVTAIADLAIATVAAMARPNFQVCLADESIEAADLDLRPDVVALTGKLTQAPRMLELAAHYRKHGCRVVAGGPFASMSPDSLRPFVDVLVEGELEEIASELFCDLAAGSVRASYRGGRPELSLSPLPAWDLYANSRALIGAVQTSRGCPFECEFCDVIQYLGRKQRFKPIPMVLRELDQLHALGYRRVFLCDDNFTVNRARAKELLAALAEWNQALPAGPMGLMTQGSIDMARDDEMLQLCAQARLQRIFVGVETPHQGSLKEAKKHQNVGLDLHERMQRVVEHGIAIEAGCVVGFDADPPDILQLKRRFWMDSVVPNVIVNQLMALESTPLHQRMKRDGRLLAPSAATGSPWWSNIYPLAGDPQSMELGLQELSRQLYEAEAFGQRLERFAQHFSTRYQVVDRPYRPGVLPEAMKAWLNCLHRLRGLGPAESDLWKRVESLSRRYPNSSSHLGPSLLLYLQQRMLLRQSLPSRAF